MIRIGDFARLGQVSVVTLRHYDEIGLLKPGLVDGTNSYRYYSVDQLARLNRIVALKDLGFSLSQVEQVLSGVTLEQLRGMLVMKHAEVDRKLSQERERLARISARLNQIAQEDKMPTYDIVVKEVPAMLVASRRVTIPTNADVTEILGGAFDEAYGLLHITGAKDVGPCLAIWRQPAAVLVNEDAEAAVPLDRALESTDRVTVYELAGSLVASVIHEGDYSSMTSAHAALLSWIESNGYHADGTYREVYVRSMGDGIEPITEIQYPVEKLAERR